MIALWEGVPIFFVEKFIASKNKTIIKTCLPPTIYETNSFELPSFNHSHRLLSRTFTTSNFLFGIFSILIKFPYKSVWCLELRFLKLSQSRAIFSVTSSHFWAHFPISYLEHSNEVFQWIILFISGIQMLITALSKLSSEVCSFFFSTSFRQQHVLS